MLLIHDEGSQLRDEGRREASLKVSYLVDLMAFGQNSTQLFGNTLRMSTSFDVHPLTVPSEVGLVQSLRQALTLRTSSKGSEAGYD